MMFAQVSHSSEWLLFPGRRLLAQQCKTGWNDPPLEMQLKVS
jgi:hypothetical protein